jgi:predicted dehydrogenase
MSPLIHVKCGQKTVVRVGMLGFGFMGRLRSHAYSVVRYMMPELAVTPELYAVAGIEPDDVYRFAQRFGYRWCTTRWQDVIADPKVDIIHVALPEDLHEEVCTEALLAGKNVFCEKPLALSVDSSRRVLEAARDYRAVAMVGFNYRFMPAIQLAHKMITEGLLGRLYFVKMSYAQESGHDPKRAAEQIRYAYGKKQLGSIRGLGSHVIDMARYLAGDIEKVAACMKTFWPDRKTSWGEEYKIKADELATVNVEFVCGAMGAFVTTALATGRKNQFAIEINGSGGSILYDVEQPNLLKVYLDDTLHPELRGFTTVNVTEKSHPLMKHWWPAGHNLGWEHSHIHETAHFLDCIARGLSAAAPGATLIDGLEETRVAEAAYRSSQAGEWQSINSI